MMGVIMRQLSSGATESSMAFVQSRSVEDFVKTVYALQQKMERVSTNALRDALGISAPSVTDMAQRLMDSGLIDYRKYRGMRLTARGEQIALMMIRRHRLIELFLVQELGYALHEVHEEAEALEHAVSDRFVEALDRKLGFPSMDPHGDPIPQADGSYVEAARDLQLLTELPLDTPARVSRFLTDDSQMLQHTLDRGFALQGRVEVLDRDPFEGPLRVRLQDAEAVIGHTVAANILVELDDDSE